MRNRGAVTGWWGKHRPMALTSTLTRVLPGRRSRLDQISLDAQLALAGIASTPVGRPMIRLLRGDEWLGRPLHPFLVTVPIGAWGASAWYDRQAARTGDPEVERKADRMLRVGVVGAVLAAATGQAQFLDTRGRARRMATVHAALNNLALSLQLGSLAARRGGRRGLGRTLSMVTLGGVAVSGSLGVDVAARLGKGVYPSALRRRR